MGVEKLCDLIHVHQEFKKCKKRTPNRTFLDELKFSELDYACVHEGREYKSTNSQCKKLDIRYGIFLVIFENTPKYTPRIRKC